MKDTKLFFGNWKMNVAGAARDKLCEELRNYPMTPKVKVAVFPSFLSIPAVAKSLNGTVVGLGAQDCFWEESGAYTGEISPSELAGLGVKYALIGHSERRENLGETSAMVNKKIKAALAAGITPVLCLGERAADRENGTWPVVLERELKEGLDGLDLVGSTQIIIAYEPIWAIGTGTPCEPDDAVAAHSLVGNYLYELFGEERKERNFSIIYGGSVDAGNIKSYFAREEIDGALVGGASQKWPTFSAALKAISE
jgi:triosephosphate isomerase (TIM)